MRLPILLPLLAGHAAGTERIFLQQGVRGFSVVSSSTGQIGVSGSIRGAGGYSNLPQAKAAGADAVRTWGIDNLPTALPQAEALGLKISAGIWMPHPKGYYDDCSNLEADPAWQREVAINIQAVRRYKNSPAILWWTAGNEIEMEVNVTGGNECTWKRLEWYVRKIKAEDPDHPVGTVLAGAHKAKVQAIQRLCPSLDFLGVNSYGNDSFLVGPNVATWGWTKPYALMEFGPTGHWVSPLTAWGAYIEETSSVKANRYRLTTESCFNDPLCIGSFAFDWGWKWEKTGTWYGLFNEWKEVTSGVGADCTQCESEIVSTLEKAWTGVDPPTVPPSIAEILVDGVPLPAMRFSGSQRQMQLEVRATQVQGKPFTAVWAVTEEIVSNAIGGAWEATNSLVPGLFGSPASTFEGLRATLDGTRLIRGKNYRLYVFVRQDPTSGGLPTQEASASLSFNMCYTAQPGEPCYDAISQAQMLWIQVHPERYPGLTVSSTRSEIQVSLAQRGLNQCFFPCDIQEWCATTKPGEMCWDEVQRILSLDLTLIANKQRYPGLDSSSTVAAVQKLLWTQGDINCVQPCPDPEPVADKDTTPAPVLILP